MLTAKLDTASSISQTSLNLFGQILKALMETSWEKKKDARL